MKSHTSYAVANVSFENIDARMWKSGIWDMWIETEDDLGNKGMAPYSGDPKKKTIDFREGFYFLRQIEIK